MLVHRIIQVTTITIVYIKLRQGFECYPKEEELTWVHNFNCSLFTESVTIVTECISNHNDTNKRNNCLILICMLNDWFIILLY